VGRLPRPYREERLTDPLWHALWHDGPLEALRPQAPGSIVWSVRLDTEAAAAALARSAHTEGDLADFAIASDAAHRLLRRRLTRALLGHLSGVAPSRIVVGRTPEGAVSVLSPKEWHLSVAGRGMLCLIGVAPAPIGVDVEPFDASPPLWDMLTPAEGAAIDRLPPVERPHEWLRRWAAKEAHAKRLGYARRADPAHIATQSIDADRLRVCSTEGISDCRLRSVGGRIEAVAL
jgi:phosphopantetheinyl transferase